MAEWLDKMRRTHKGPFIRLVAQVVVVFMSILELVALLSDIGFQREVEIYRYVIVISVLIIALVLSIGPWLWQWSPSRQFINRLFIIIRTRIHLVQRRKFVEDFSQPELPNWKFSGEWHTETDENGHFLVVTQSEMGGIAKPCLEWKDYIFKFDTKIVHHSTSWIIRAARRGHYVLLQCQKTRLRPHFFQADRLALVAEWTDPNTVKLPCALPLNEWFTVCIRVAEKTVVVILTVNGEEYEVLNSPLLAPPIAPETYSVGSVGFRASEYECANFRNAYVKRLS